MAQRLKTNSMKIKTVNGVFTFQAWMYKHTVTNLQERMDQIQCSVLATLKTHSTVANFKTTRLVSHKKYQPWIPISHYPQNAPKIPIKVHSCYSLGSLYSLMCSSCCYVESLRTDIEPDERRISKKICLFFFAMLKEIFFGHALVWFMLIWFCQYHHWVRAAFIQISHRFDLILC